MLLLSYLGLESKTYQKTFYLAKEIPKGEVYFGKYIELAFSEKLKYYKYQVKRLWEITF